MGQAQEKTQPWTAKRRAALVIERLRGDTSIQIDSVYLHLG